MARSEKGIYIRQQKYALDLLANSGTNGAFPVKPPLDQNLTLSKEDGELLPDPSLYKRLIGKCMNQHVEIIWFCMGGVVFSISLKL